MSGNEMRKNLFSSDTSDQFAVYSNDWFIWCKIEFTISTPAWARPSELPASFKPQCAIIIIEAESWVTAGDYLVFNAVFRL